MPTEMPDTYRVQCWECEGPDEHDNYVEEGWVTAYAGIPKWRLRDVLRCLYGWGWSWSTIRVEAETHDRDAARWSRDSTYEYEPDWRLFDWIRKHGIEKLHKYLAGDTLPRSLASGDGEALCVGNASIDDMPECVKDGR